jgi:hypothetical protein
MSRFNQFLGALVFLLVPPLTPLAAEYIKTQDVKSDNLSLCISFYAFCLSASTKYYAVFSVCLLMGILETFRYRGTNTASGLPLWNNFEFYTFTIVFVAHFAERINRHWVNAETFFQLT